MEPERTTEQERIAEAYARRSERGADAAYGGSDPWNRFLVERREADLTSLLRRQQLLPLASRRIVDVGCGGGDVLGMLARLGAQQRLMAGIDLLPERVDAARERLPAADIRQGDASALPWPDASFEIALQFTILSSVLDAALRRAIADETMRVLAPGGVLIWYDFTWNPTNRDVRGIGRRELAALYPGRAIAARRVTLAPPIGRRVAPISTRLCRILEAAPFLRSHIMAAVRK